jgi:hypothetical protein
MAHSPSIYMAHGRCQSKAVRGDHLEHQVWSGVETFLRNPEPVPQQLHAELEAKAQGSGQFRKQVTRLEGLLAQKGHRAQPGGGPVPARPIDRRRFGRPDV